MTAEHGPSVDIKQFSIRTSPASNSPTRGNLLVHSGVWSGHLVHDIGYQKVFPQVTLTRYDGVCLVIVGVIGDC